MTDGDNNPSLPCHAHALDDQTKIHIFGLALPNTRMVISKAMPLRLMPLTITLGDLSTHPTVMPQHTETLRNTSSLMHCL